MKVVVLVPCFNEETTVAQVIKDFRTALPEAEIVVCDNNSTDRTAEHARIAGATVYSEHRRGKGFVVSRMFQEIDADVYVIVDGDSTYPATAVRKLIAPIVEDKADMVVGSRLHQGSQSQFRFVNRVGNHFFAYMFRLLFKSKLTDILSGYRAFNRAFIRNVPLFGGGFEVEAELTVKALLGGFRIIEIPVNLTHRPPQSESKIRIVHDGWVILSTILALVRDYKPLTIFGTAGLLFIAIGALPGAISVRDYIRQGTLTSPAAAAIGVWLMTVGILLVVAGFILHSVSRHFQELSYRLRRIEGDLSTESPRKRAAGASSHAG